MAHRERADGRGRSRTNADNDVEATFQEYLRQCQEQQGADGDTHSSPGTSESNSSASTVIDAFARFSTRDDSRSTLPNQPSSFLTGVPPSRGRGRGTGRPFDTDSQSDYSPGMTPQPRSPSGTTPPHGGDRPSFGGSGSSLGRGRGRGSTVFPETVFRPGAEIPIPALNPSKGRGRGTVRRLTLEEPGPGLPVVDQLPNPEQSMARYADAPEPERETIIRKGDKGIVIPVTANFIRLAVEKGRGLFMYHVDFEPELASVRMRRYMLQGHDNILGTVRNFDGAKLYLPFKLPDYETVLYTTHPTEIQQTVTITIRFIKENRMDENVHFYNVLFRRIMEKLGMEEVNRNFYDYRARHRLPVHRLEIWPGYVTAVDEFEGGLMLCCDVSHRVLRTATLLDVYNDMHHENRGNTGRFRQMYRDYVVSKVVLTRYNRKNYRVDDVDFTLNPRSTFELGSGERISYVEYYKNQYNITITDLDQPLIIHKPRPPKVPRRDRRPVLELVCLIPECCNMTGLTEELKKDHKVMRDVAEHTRVPPHRRTVAIQEFVKTVKANPEAAELLTGWGLALEDATIELPARRIAPPHIVINQDKILTKQFDFTRDAMQNPCLEPIHVRQWAIFCTSFDRPKAETFVEHYFTVCRNIGINVLGNPKIIPVHGQQRRLVESFSRTIMENLTSNLQFVVVIVPAEIGELYESIKRICCLERPIPSQVILAKTLGNERQVRSIVSKIALQINCKLGGALWTIRIPLGEKIMFVGMDVYHDPKRRNPSILALVASLNEMQTKYFSRIVSQRRHQEIGDSLKSIFADCLKTFHKCSGVLPDRIVVFRDGVGDGQLDLTKDTEVVQMLDVLNRMYTEMPKFTFTIVQKRISCRIYGQDPDTGRFVNAPSGTVLDHTVTRKYLYDFFLVSQLVLQGTVNPTHYIVLEDIGNVQPDLIQKFAFATSFLYYNWAAPIRVPAVCQYAHKLAFLVGQYIKEAPADALSCQLYYL